MSNNIHDHIDNMDHNTKTAKPTSSLHYWVGGSLTADGSWHPLNYHQEEEVHPTNTCESSAFSVYKNYSFTHNSHVNMINLILVNRNHVVPNGKC